MDFLYAVILGVVEGLTEFLPVSSTGHLILASSLLGFEPTDDFIQSFEIAIQLGAILAVVAIYGRRIATDRKVWTRVVVAFLPSAAVGFVLYNLVKKILLGNVQVVLWSLLVGGVCLVAFEWCHKGRKDEVRTPVGDISHKQAFGIGMFQCLAIVPGVSRSASTILGGLLLGLPRRTVVEFSFLLAIPTMFAATGLDLVKSHASFSADDFAFLAVGGLTAFVTAFASVKFLLRYVERHTFIAFGVYRILAALLFWGFVKQ